MVQFWYEYTEARKKQMAHFLGQEVDINIFLNSISFFYSHFSVAYSLGFNWHIIGIDWVITGHFTWILTVTGTATSA